MTFRNSITNALALAFLFFASPLAAEQGTIVGPVVGPKTMPEVMTTVNAALLAIQSCNSGTSAPANGPGAAPKAFQCWADTSASPVITYKTYDGASWVTFGALNTSTHVWTPYRNGAPIAAVATSSSAADLTTGTLPAARLPSPSASTLGGVQSKTCSASQWLNDLSTGGALSCAQPNFTDLAGTAALAQLPAFSGMTGAAAAGDADTFPTNQGAGNLKQTLAAVKTWIKAWIVKADVGLGNVDNTSDITKWAASKTLTNTTFACNGTGNSCVVRVGTDVTGLGTGVATALAVNIGSAGAPVLFNGAGGTPSAMVATNLTGTAAGLTAGNVTTNANLTGEVTSVGNATTVTNASVIAKVLTAFSAGAGTVSSSDSILTAVQKIVGNLALKADLASPALTGSPTATTASPSNNSTRIATTAYVDAQVAGGVSGVGSINGQAGAITGIDTNTLNSVTANYTIQTSDCGSTVQAGTGSTGLFTITLPSVSGFDSKCQLTVVNGDTGRGKKLSGFPTTMTSSGVLWPGQGVSMKIVNGAWTAPRDPGRWKTTGGMSLYVDKTSGSDANDGLASGTGAFLTLNKCATAAYNFFDSQGGTITCNGNGVFQEFVPVFYQMASGGTLLFSGSGAFTWKPINSGFALQFGDGALVGVTNVTFSGAGTTSPQGYILGHNHGVLDLNTSITMETGGLTGSMISCDFDTHFNINNGLTISNATGALSGFVYRGCQGSRWDINGAHTFSGTPVIGRFAYATSGSLMLFEGNVTFSGATSISPSILSGNSVINNLSGTTLSGGTPTAATGSQYCTSVC